MQRHWWCCWRLMEPILQRDPSRLSVESFSFPYSAKHVDRSYCALQHADRNLLVSSDTVGRRPLAVTLHQKHRQGGGCIGTPSGNRLSARCRLTSRGGMGESGGGFRKKGELRIFENVDELATNLADYVSELSEAAVKDRGAFAVALSGGSLIGSLGKLTEAPYIKTVDWAKWHVFWADERVVAKNNPDSNYKLAKDGLLSKVPIIPGHVYSINDSLCAEAAAEDYAFGLRQLVKTRTVDVSKSSDCPKFDLILLGMGPDGHIASLFPNHPLINEKEEWISFITDSPKPPPERITFTLPVINSAANVVMVVTGVGKAATLQRVLSEELSHCSLPAQMVSPKDGKLVWFADKEAASKLTGSETVTIGS